MISFASKDLLYTAANQIEMAQASLVTWEIVRVEYVWPD